MARGENPNAPGPVPDEEDVRNIEECSVKNLRSSDLRVYVDFLGLGKWFARWQEANPKLARRLDVDGEAKGKGGREKVLEIDRES
jgi:hypothetical protein